MLRSEFLALVPLTVWTAACGDSEPRPQVPAGSGGGGAGTSGSGGVSAQATGGSTAEAGGASGSSGGKAGAGSSPSSAAGTGPSQGGSGGAAPAACLNVERSVGAFALAKDFSTNSDTGTKEEHTLLMDRGAMIRQQLDYQTTGEDHAHAVAFTVEQLAALMAGQTIVVETEGPPLNASSGHSHTVTVHPCPGAKL